MALADLPLFTADRMTYRGKVSWPSNADGGGDPASYKYGFGIRYEESTNTFLVACHGDYGKLGRLNNPTPKMSAFNSMARAASDNGPRDVTAGGWAALAGAGQHRFGTPYVDSGGRLLFPVHNFYGGNDGQQWFVKANAVIGSGDATGPYGVGALEFPPSGGEDQGATCNWIEPIPSQVLPYMENGEDVIVGNGEISILSSTSAGPAMFAVKAADIGVTDPAPMFPLMYFYIEDSAPSHPLNEDYWVAAGSPRDGTPPVAANADIVTMTNPYFNGYSKYMGMFLPEGYRSAMFLHKHTDAAVTYPGGSFASVGPAVFRVMAFDWLELLDAYNGLRAPWSLRPHAYWDIQGDMVLPAVSSDEQIQPRGYTMRRTGLSAGINSQWFVRFGEHPSGGGEEALHSWDIADAAAADAEDNQTGTFRAYGGRGVTRYGGSTDGASRGRVRVFRG